MGVKISEVSRHFIASLGCCSVFYIRSHGGFSSCQAFTTLPAQECGWKKCIFNGSVGQDKHHRERKYIIKSSKLSEKRSIISHLSNHFHLLKVSFRWWRDGSRTNNFPTSWMAGNLHWSVITILILSLSALSAVSPEIRETFHVQSSGWRWRVPVLYDGWSLRAAAHLSA